MHNLCNFHPAIIIWNHAVLSSMKDVFFFLRDEWAVTYDFKFCLLKGFKEHG
jgi:hypothetical protein